MKEELITIIVPIYNAESSIEKCVNSIINQTYKNLEILLINDGSTDKSLDVCKKIQKKDDRIVLIDKLNEKVSKTRNRGLKEANGDYIIFVDSDDYIEQNMVIDLSKGINGFDLCTCNYNVVVNNEKILRSKLDSFNTDKKNVYIEKMQQEWLFNPLWNKIYKTDIIKNNSIYFDENIQVGEDYLFNINYIKCAKKIKYITNPLYNYVVQENSLSKKYIKRTVKDEIKIPRTLKKLYEEEKYDMGFVYNQYIEILKSNIVNLITGKKDKIEVRDFIENYVYEIKEDKLEYKEVRKNLTIENRMIYKTIMNKNENIIYNYFKLREKIKKILLKR